MKDIIKFYYNLDGEVINGNSDCYLFLCDDNYYYYERLRRTKEELNDIIKVIEETKRKQIKTNEIVVNINGEYITNDYILIKINCFLDEEITIKDILNYNNKLVINDKYLNNWALLWKQKIDYLEYQIRELGKDKKILIHSFSYFVGVAENALVMLNKVNKKYQNDSILVLSRIRLQYPEYEKDYFNPHDFIFDTRMRDIAEYLKSKFFKGEDLEDDLNLIFNTRYTPYEYNIFYARMLFPSYYFDLYEDIILNKKEEKELYNILNKIDEYEYFLKGLYFYLSKYTIIEYIEWLIKKE